MATGVEALSAIDGVAYVQPNYLYAMADTTEGEDDDDDESEPLTPTTINDPRQGYFLNESHLDCYRAWSLKKCEGDVAVAVIDSGVAEHEDLDNNVVARFKTDKAWGNANEDEDEHGTHVAGIIAGEANNGTGMAGVSYNAKIVGIKACVRNETPDKNGKYKFSFPDSELIQALNIVIENKDEYDIRVVNMSIGSVITYGDNYDALEERAETDNEAAEDKAVVEAINRAYDNNIVVVGSAGNENHTFSNPFDYTTNCITVININSAHQKASSSNYNAANSAAAESAKNLSAPGEDIYSTFPDNKKHSDDTYAYESGTSMASPMVAGVAALVFAANGKLTAADCIGILYDTATDLGEPGWDQTYGYGEVNAYRAVSAALGKTATVSDGDDLASDVEGMNSYTYTGKAIEPDIEKPDWIADGAEVYENNVEVGTATAIYRGKGDDFGKEARKTFTITHAVTAEGPFTDLDPDAWYLLEGLHTKNGEGTTYLDYVVARGIMSGYGDDGSTFGPDDTITRATVATILYRAATGKIAQNTLDGEGGVFDDVAADAWYATPVEWCQARGIVTGYSGTNKFGPNDEVTREQLATMMARFVSWRYDQAPDPEKVKNVYGAPNCYREEYNAFRDTGDVSDWAEAAVAYCCDINAITGIDNYIKPQDTATRAQLAKIATVVFESLPHNCLPVTEANKEL